MQDMDQSLGSFFESLSTEENKAQRADFYARHFFFSKLEPANREENFLFANLRLLMTYLEPITAYPFVLSNADVIVFYPKKYQERIDIATDGLVSSLRDDPLVSWHDASRRGLNFYKGYSCAQDFEELQALVERIDENQKRQKISLPKISLLSSALEPSSLKFRHLDGASFDDVRALMRDLKMINLRDFLKKQAICTMKYIETPKVVFKERYLNIKDIEKLFLDGKSLYGAKWLFHYLLSWMDKQLLEGFAFDRPLLSHSVSFNMSVEAVLSKQFANWVGELSEHERSNLHIELDFREIFMNFGAFQKAVQRCKEQGLKVVLDGMNLQHLSVLNLSYKNIDYVKAQWILNYSQIDPVYIPESLQNKMILTHCDGRRSIERGKELGFKMFQGYFVDAMLFRSHTDGETIIHDDDD